MNDEERRRFDRGWNDPPMFTQDQLNKQPSSNIPLNKRYKYPTADQQLLANQMYQQAGQAGGFMQDGYAKAYGPNQYSQQQQTGYPPNPSLAYNPMYQQSGGLPQTYPGNYGQQPHQQSHYAQQYSPYGQSTQLPNQPIVSQSLGTNQSLAYQQGQTSAYLPNAMNPTNQPQQINQSQLNEMGNPHNSAISSTGSAILNPHNPVLNTQQQIPVTSSMMHQPNLYGNQMQPNQQFNQYGQQMYNQPGSNAQQQYSLQNQYQY